MSLTLGIHEAIIYGKLPDTWKEWVLVLVFAGSGVIQFVRPVFPTLDPWILLGGLLLLAAAVLITLAGVSRWAVREVRFRRSDAFPALSQPHILVRNLDALSQDQSVFVNSFHLVNNGSAAGYVDVAITVNGSVVRTYTFLVRSGEDRIFRPSEDALHSFSPSDDTIPLHGGSSQVISYEIGNVWKA